VTNLKFFVIYAVVFSDAVVIKLFSEYILNNFRICNIAAHNTALVLLFNFFLFYSVFCGKLTDCYSIN